MTGGGEGAAEVGVGVEAVEGGGECVGIAGRDVEAVAFVFDELAEAADVRCDDGEAGGPCFEDDDAEGFVAGGEDECGEEVAVECGFGFDGGVECDE
jgi:hypothetical protein